MPQTDELHLEETVCRFGCSPDTFDPTLMAERDATAAPPPTTQPNARQIPQILLRSDPVWRRACLAQTAHIPAGYTYLSQLMGHDMGSSVSMSSVPHARRGKDMTVVAALGPKRYNLIDNPLTLESIYGSGPAMASTLYDPDTLLFRLTPGARLARVYRVSPDPLSDRRELIRALYDERNRDTLMLHELTVAWMQFHNLCARSLLPAHRPFQAYVIVRNHAVRVWHHIVARDILPRFMHPDIAALPQIPQEWRLDETTLLHGLFRAFHAMPLAAYHLGRSGSHNLRVLLKTGFDHSEAERDWAVDWALLFGEKPGGPKTGLSASVAPELRAPVSAAAVIALDNRSAAEALPLRPGNPAIVAALAQLPAIWRDRLTPNRLAQDFNTRFSKAPIDLTAEVVEWGPLFQMMMIEAQLYGQNGGLGPFGSALLRGSIMGSIDRVALAPELPAAQNLPRPATMLELIKLVRRG